MAPAPRSRHNGADTAASSQFSQPRRNPSKSSKNPSVSRPGVAELLPAGDRVLGISDSFQQSVPHQRSPSSPEQSDDQMDVDDSPLLRPGDAERTLHPLRAMADRVGREVERFAEALDSWKPELAETPEAKKGAILSLATEYRAIALDTVQTLTARHASALELEFRETWRASAGSRSNNNEASRRQGESSPMHTTAADLRAWKSEYNTWDLVIGLLGSEHQDYNRTEAELSYNSEDSPSSGGESLENRFTADGSVWQSFLSSSSQVQEKAMVLKWLEMTAERSGNDLAIIEDESEKESGRGPGLWTQEWLETREKIKGEKRLRLWDVPLDSELPPIKRSRGDGLLVTQLDPDAPTRQDRMLEEADVAYDDYSWAMIWEMLRRGKSTKDIRDWLCYHNQHARAASIAARPLEDTGANSSSIISTRSRWRYICRLASQRGGTSVYEKAVFGLLGGDEAALDSVCHTWDDRLFSKYNSHLLSKYNIWLQSNHPDMISMKYGIKSTSAKDESTIAGIWRVAASASGNSVSTSQAQQAFDLIQASLVGHDFTDFVFTQGVGLSCKVVEEKLDSVSQLISGDLAEKAKIKSKVELIIDNMSALRVLTHIVLLSKELGYTMVDGDAKDAKENVIAAYIDFLRLAGKMELIPLYASTLTKERAEITLARVLPDILHGGQRQEYVQLLKSYNLDIVEILVNQYEFAMSYSTLASESAKDIEQFQISEAVSDSLWPSFRIKAPDDSELEEEEEAIIRSMVWFLYLPGQWALTFATLTDVAVRFLAKGRTRAAIELFERLSFSEVSKTKTPGIVGIQMDVMESDRMSNGDARPATRHSRALRSVSARGVTPQAEVPHETIAQMRNEAMTYYQLNRLIECIKAMWKWRAVEDEWTGSASTGTMTGRNDTRSAIDDLCTASSAILDDFCTHTTEGEHFRLEHCPIDSADYFKDVDTESLRKLRYAYLPSLLLAQISALQCAGSLISREYLLKCLDLSITVANSPSMMECLIGTKRAPEVVDAFACVSRALLLQNERAGGKAVKAVKASRSGWTTAIWNVEK